ncbi:LPS export ABC transporter periplasmic protein LptC [Carboxylicivirga caseinilyticus]|uniref:LPS export ABC transporter periplasmic protein LptC n=1 Tax=Carboxylicivirga caseinilyticus TaxID=3417572 RepID=UPI003D33F55D
MIPYFKNTKHIIYSASSILLLAVYVLSSSCSTNKPEEIQAISNREEIPSLVFRDLESVFTDSGRVQRRVITPEMKHFTYSKDEARIEFPQGLNVITYNTDGSVKGQIKARHAIYYEKDELWELNNDVEAVSEKNEILNTEQLFWDTKKEIIYSDKFVKITSESGIWMGTGFDADQNMDQWEIRDISGEMEFEDDGSN